MKMVNVSNLVKTYSDGAIKAVSGVSFDVNEGEIFGLIGPDGSGKTSIFRILTTLLLPDSGSATVNKYDVVRNFKEIRKVTGYMPGKFSLYPDLSVEENLNFFATLFNTSIKKNYELVKDIYIQIEPFKSRRAGKLSGGMKQKLALCCALIHRPKVLILDEPTTGVDTVSRKELWDMLLRLKKQGITILVSTPYMDEAGLCDRIALIQQGTTMSIDTPSNIIRRFPENLFAIKSESMSALLKDLRSFKEISSSYAFGEYHHITFKNQNDLGSVVNLLKKSNHNSVEIMPITPTIEDCFIRLMN